MFKATKVEKKREINLLIDQQISLSLCKTLDYYLPPSLERWLGIKNVLRKFFAR